MAPARSSREPSIDRSPEYSDFIAKLAAYHQQRGTHFDPEPKIGSRHVDLLQLFKIVVAKGGYDKVTDVKTLWTRIGTDELHFDKTIQTLGFNMKTAYYKNLAAYEISTIHGREPPPKEILELLTAKGGNLLTRTLENYQPSRVKDAGATPEVSGDDGTPARRRSVSEEAPGSGGRATRGLRAAPTPRTLYQDTQVAQQPRQSRNVSHTSTPQAGHLHPHQQQHQPVQIPRGASTSYNPSTNMENMSAAVTNYEPRPVRPMEYLRPVVTPGNNAVEFAKRQRLLEAAGQPPPRNKDILLPGTGFDGPNIYVRCLGSMKSGIPAEQDYALHHLVKISMERGDKYLFKGFPGLAETLIEKLLEVSSLFYKVDWQITYLDEGLDQIDVLNGIEGTPDILRKLERLEPIVIDDNFRTAELSDAMLQITEAALTLRNMVMLEDNAMYVSGLAPLRDLMSIALSLPDRELLTEFKHDILEICEQVTRYWHMDVTDPLYICLLWQVGHSDDRGVILTSLRAISRISMNLEENNLLKGIPLAVIQKIVEWPLLNDEELAHACLDFLYQYTAVIDNVDFLLKNVQLEPLVNQLTRLLLHNAKTMRVETTLGHDYRVTAPLEIAPLPEELFAELLKLDEPQRSSVWLRSLFEEDPTEAITQIAMWQAYAQCFNGVGVPNLLAAEFIKNVSTTFEDKAAAQVQGQSGTTQRFIIKGIRYRRVPVDQNGEEYRTCLWRTPFNGHCGQYFMTPESMYQHILKTHLSAVVLPDGTFQNVADGTYSCAWDKCKRFNAAPVTTLAQLAAHIKCHLPPRREPSRSNGPRPASKPSYIVLAPKQAIVYRNTATDERNEAAGIPLTAILVLRNLARNIPKTETEEKSLNTHNEAHWVDSLFMPIMPHLFETMVDNKSLRTYMSDLIYAVHESCFRDHD